MIKRETSELLQCEEWSKLSFESVLEVLGMEWLECEEAELVRALMRWGSCQAKEQHQIRQKIVPGLKLIRFAGLTPTTFAHLSQTELAQVLTLQEKHSILLALVTGDWKTMPDQLVQMNLQIRNRHLQAINFSSSSED